MWFKLIADSDEAKTSLRMTVSWLSLVSAHPEISTLNFVECLDSQTLVLQESGWSQLGQS